MSRTNIAPIVYATVLAAAVYFFTLAPGLTWANHGADGGELIAAAMQNGVPHPPGYPLYILLLQGWLGLGKLLFPLADNAWLGNLFSALCAALSVGLTVRIVAHILEQLNPPHPTKLTVDWSVWGWATVAGLAWALAPLFWGQALITEVYALHLLLTVLLAWSLLVKNGRPRYLIPSIALGISHHLTFVLLLPAALYWLLFRNGQTPLIEPKAAPASTPDILTQKSSNFVPRFVKALLTLCIGILIGLFFYLRIPLAASSGPPAINWGYADSLSGFVWLISADAYRPYLFGLPTSSILQRISAWAYITTAQFTPVGLAFALLGLSYLDKKWTRLRTFSLLWSAPICIYAIGYHTRDSEIYLLPFIWIMALWLGVGLWYASKVMKDWLLGRNIHVRSALFPLIGLLLVLGLGLSNWPSVSLRTDRAAIDFLAEAKQVIEPNSIIYSSADAETFALWYGAWGADEAWNEGISEEPILVNSALLQFEWYQRLIRERYAEIAGMDQLTLDRAVSQPLIDNIAERPIYFSEEPSYIPAENLETVGRFWRYASMKIPSQ